MALLLAAKKTSLSRYLRLPNVGRAVSGLRERATVHSSGEDLATESHLSPTEHDAMPGVAPFRINYSVEHHIAGRIRIEIPRLSHDAAFAQRLEHGASQLPDVTKVRVTRRAKSIVVEYSTHSGAAGKARRGEAMLSRLVDCICVAAGVDEAHNSARLPTGEDAGRINYMERLGLPVLGLGLSVGAVAGLGIPGMLIGGAVLASATPIFQRTAQGIRDEKRLTVDFLDATAIVLLTAQASFLAPAFIVGVIEGSEVTRDWTARRTRNAELELLSTADGDIVVERDGHREKISIDSVAPGDTIVTFTGDQIVVDGLVTGGRALVDQSRLTGDSELVDSGQGDTVYASSLVTDGHLRILAQHTGGNTQIARTRADIATLPVHDTRVSNHARKVGNDAVVPTLLVGGAVYATSGSLARLTGIVSLDLGTGMRVSAPIAVLAAQSNAASHGILIRSGRALESLAEIDTVVFDKTATLTQGRTAVIDIAVSDESIGPSALLALAASAEQELDHPAAHAIVQRARQEVLSIPPCSSWSYETGLGVTATVDGRQVYVGNRQMMQAIGMAEMGPQDSYPGLAQATGVYVARDGRLLGRLYFTDPVRTESADVIRRLHHMHIHSHVFSGDRYPVSQAVAVDIGIRPDNVYAEILPQRKVEIVQSLRARGRKVAVVGDGVNDVVAMAQADVSVAMANATDLARETADIVLMRDDLRDLIVALEIARNTTSIIKQNRALVVVPNVTAIAYGAMAVLNPTAGVVINNGVALLAALNSMRLVRGTGRTVESGRASSSD